jgi:hypothetical protein
VGSLLELGHVLSDGGSTDTSVAVDVEVVSESDDDLLDLLGELSGWGEDQSLGLLDRGVDLGKVSICHATILPECLLTRCRIETEKVAVFPVPD